MRPIMSDTGQEQEKQPRVRVRMYRQGLGDCFLVTFYTGETPVHALIDCGTLGTSGGVTMAEVVADVVRETGGIPVTAAEEARAAREGEAMQYQPGHLDLLVATHEHKDHVSGFNTERDAFEKQLVVDHVWAAWTEDGSDPLAREVEKYKGDVLQSVAQAAHALAADHAAAPDDRESVANLRSGMRELLGFLGDLPGEGEPIGLGFASGVQDAMSYVTRRADAAVRFLSPGTVLQEAWLPGVRVYVLGPPRDRKKLGNMGGHGSSELYGVAAQFGTSLRFGASGKTYDAYRAELTPEAADEFHQQLPFEPRFRVEQADQKACGEHFANYYDPDAAWRRIDLDWLNGSGELALQLDSLTNNTSLALAFELDDGTVLLFPGDAQVGNWLSWHDQAYRVDKKEVKAADLLARTVFYKVGHHASHNATVDEKGLELMVREDLMAAIPVDREVALRKHPKWMMPADALYARLVEKTHGRVIRSDTGWPENHPPDDPERIEISRLRVDFKLY
ncbi:MAG: hypothetical protein ACJ8GN_08895 [Longimicrobiaceae bacterium]